MTLLFASCGRGHCSSWLVRERRGGGDTDVVQPAWGDNVAGHPAKRGKELLARSGLPLAPDAIGEEDASKARYC